MKILILPCPIKGRQVDISDKTETKFTFDLVYYTMYNCTLYRKITRDGKRCIQQVQRTSQVLARCSKREKGEHKEKVQRVTQNRKVKCKEHSVDGHNCMFYLAHVYTEHICKEVNKQALKNLFLSYFETILNS